jgi:hypothetical protein
MATSFAPKDFGTAAWQGGTATITDPKFVYQSFNVTQGKNAGTTQKVVKLTFELMDPEGNPHKAYYEVGNAEYCKIYESADEGADEAEEGPAFGNSDPKRPYRVYPESGFAQLIQSLVLAGFPESKLMDGDITVLDGLEVEITPKKLKEKDKYSTYLVSGIHGKAGAKKTSKPAAAAKGNGKTAGGDDAITAATELVLEQLADSDTVTQANLVKAAMTKFKGQDVKGAVVTLLSKGSFLADSDAWAYDAEDKTVTAV